jgi:hypothetical protein
VGEQWEPARRKVEVIAHIAGELRLWRVAGTNDSFQLTPSIFGPKINGSYEAILLKNSCLVAAEPLLAILLKITL